LKRFLIYWLPVVALCTFIFVQSAFPSPDVLPGWPFSDKFAHAGAYGLLAFLLGRAFSTVGRLQRNPVWLWALSVVLSTLYGLSDEWHQSFVAARTADAADLLADAVGAAAGAWIWLKVRLRFKDFPHPGKNSAHD
jgi:VanZ family protein